MPTPKPATKKSVVGTKQRKRKAPPVQEPPPQPSIEELMGPRVCPHCGTVMPSPARRPARAMPEELTDRQLAVLRMVAMGHTAQQIGAALHISRRTAEFHRGALMNKLGLRTTSELTIYALANRLVNV